jgi:polyphosphate glucokinase
MPETNAVLGIDIGGTGIKAAVIDVETGKFLSERYRVDTPQPVMPETVATAVVGIVRHFDWHGIVGIGFPSIIKNGVVFSAANIHKSWMGVNTENLFGQATGLPVFVINDADAAGISAVRFGAGMGKKGVLVFITLGTGIGSALFLDGKLLPGTEFGHLYLNRQIVEKQMSNAVRKRENLTPQEWGKRLNRFFRHLERIISPDYIIVGGGGGKRFEEFAPFIKLKTTQIMASILQNDAGIIGAALHATDQNTARLTANIPS